MMDLPRMMAFIDGENLVARYQAMLADGREPNEKPYAMHHDRDTYVWSRKTIQSGPYLIIRATYYTYVIGDEGRVDATRAAIKELRFDQPVSMGYPCYLTPCVSKKEKQSAKGKGVDIQMTVDILSHIYQNTVEAVYLVSGDGDYLSVVNEVIRSGKHIYIAALSSGLNPQLRLVADRFVNLDAVYFKS